MNRSVAAAVALATLAIAVSVFPAAASAQTYGQPVYLDGWGRPIGGTPLSEIETRSHVETGRWADGYTDRPRVYVPAPAYGRGYGYARPRSYGGYGHGYGYRRSYDYGRSREYGRYDLPSQPGYRDEWGYNDDRPPSAQRSSHDRYSSRYDRDCGCGDVYLYDR